MSFSTSNASAEIVVYLLQKLVKIMCIIIVNFSI